jgi:putative membrane protein
MTLRKAKTFIPSETEQLDQVPESITAGERLPNVPEYASIRLTALPLKGLKSFLYGLGILLTLLFGWEIYTVVKSALEIHWLAAAFFLALVLVVSVLGIRALWNYFRDQENYEQLATIRAQAEKLSTRHDIAQGKALVLELNEFYQEKPQAVYLKRAVDSLPDYSNDREVVTHIDQSFLQPLDDEALRRISNYSLQSGVAVALSPWASLDMMLALWRSMKMIDSIGEVYGTRPSLLNRYRLLRSVIHQLAFVGISDLIIDNLVEESAKASLIGASSTRLGQGLGAATYSVRIGIAAMKVSRPIAFNDNNKPKLKAVVTPMLNRLRDKVTGNEIV